MSAAPRFAIGDTIYWPTFDSADKWIECPDCGGTLKLKVVLWDGSEFDIPCTGCDAGFEGPRGKIKTYARSPAVHRGVVNGLEITREAVEYKITADGCRYWCVKDADAYTSREDALAACAPLIAKGEAEDRRRIAAKVKDHRSWAWHVTYHRRELRRLHSEIHRHEEALGVARRKAKEFDNA